MAALLNLNIIPCPFYLPLLLHHLPAPGRKKMKKTLMFSSSSVLGKWCLITSSSSSAASCHLHKQEQKETLAFRLSLMGILVWVDIHPDLGQWKVEEAFPKARWCILKSSGKPPARPQGQEGTTSCCPTWCLAHSRPAEQRCGSYRVALNTPCEPLTAVALGHVFVGCTQFINKLWDFADGDEQTTSNERGKRRMDIHLTRGHSVTSHQISLLAWVEKYWHIDLVFSKLITNCNK